MKTISHPVLFINKSAIARLKGESCDSFQEFCRLSTINSAVYFAQMPPLEYERNVHNEHLLRAREVQGRIIALLCAWEMTGNNHFRDAVINYVRMMKEWQC